jgi:hypothetical protein
MPKRTLFSSHPFTPIPILKSGLVFIFALVATMAVISGYNLHPDEHSHILAVQYYLDYWLPPAIGDPVAKHTYSIWGHSYLNNWGVEYFLTGKLAWLLTDEMPQPLIAMRLFNVFLFLGLIVIILRRSRQHTIELIPLVVLLMTPQAWYIFSYVNDDAFALFLSLIIVSEITYPASPLNRFLKAPAFGQGMSGGLLFGLLLGLLLLSKENYYTFLVFIGLWLVYTSMSLRWKKREGVSKFLPQVAINKSLLGKYSLVLVIAFSVFAARYALDVAINGNSSFASRFGMNIIFGKPASNSKLLAYQEEVALPAFKPSTIQNDLKNSYYSIHLKEKGVSYSELFTQWRWHESSFKSFVGNYGMMTIFAPEVYYYFMGFLYVAFLLCLIISILARKQAGQIFFLGVTLLAVLATILISTYHSWINAFQPQGRYLFPIIGMMGLLIYHNRQSLNSLLANVLLVSGFGASVYSFLMVGIYRLSHS